MTGYRPTVADAYDNDSGLGGNRAYMSLLATTWDEACEAVQEESRLLAQHGGDASAAQAAHDARVEEEEQGDPWLAGLDVGVAGAVLALSAAGALTASSCNGAQGHHEAGPVVVLAADHARLAAVRVLAARCGLTVRPHEWLTVLDGPLRAFTGLAAAVLAAKGEFDAMERPRPYTDEGWDAPLYRSWG